MADASIVFVGHRALSYFPPRSRGVYHLTQRYGYHQKTRCGIVIWANDQREATVWPVRRDVAERFARLCGRCADGPARHPYSLAARRAATPAPEGEPK